MTPEQLDRRLRGEMAVSIAQATLKLGDRLYVTRCGGRHVTVTYLDRWWGCWIVTATLDDIHPLGIVRVNGKPRALEAEPEAILSHLPASARQALAEDCRRRVEALHAKVSQALATSDISEDEIPF